MSYKMTPAQLPTRLAIAERMKEYGRIDTEFVVMEADIGGMTGSKAWGESFPERYFNMGIAEQNMVSAAAGMAAEGRTVIGCTYGVFLTMRALESVRTFVCYPNLNVKFLSGHAGLTAALDGVTHQATEDVAMMTTLPNMKVLQPCDTVSSKAVFDIMMENPGPAFSRVMRDPLFDIYPEGEKFELGGSKVLTDGTDITIATYGDMVFQSLEAAETLAKDGIRAQVLDMYSIKPFDADGLKASLDSTGALIVVENHQAANGLGYAIANWCLVNGISIPYAGLGLKDTFAESGDYPSVIDKYGLSARCIVDAAQATLKKKG